MSSEVFVRLERSQGVGGKLGFDISGGRDFGGKPKIARVDTNSLATRKGIQRDDIIAKINDSKTDNMTHAEARAELKNCESIKLQLIRKAANGVATPPSHTFPPKSVAKFTDNGNKEIKDMPRSALTLTPPNQRRNPVSSVTNTTDKENARKSSDPGPAQASIAPTNGSLKFDVASANIETNKSELITELRSIARDGQERKLSDPPSNINGDVTPSVPFVKVISTKVEGETDHTARANGTVGKASSTLLRSVMAVKPNNVKKLAPAADNGAALDRKHTAQSPRFNRLGLEVNAGFTDDKTIRFRRQSHSESGQKTGATGLSAVTTHNTANMCATDRRSTGSIQLSNQLANLMNSAKLAGPRCFACKQAITGPYTESTNGHTYCRAHFVCSKCGTSLTSGGHMIHNSELYCLDDYVKYKADCCAKCLRPIIETVVKALGKDWHTSCFTCAHCGELLADNFSSEGGKPYCNRDYKELFLARCTKCRKFIDADHFYVEVGKNVYHKECLACAVCDCSLDGARIFNSNGTIYCASHKSMAGGSVC